MKTKLWTGKTARQELKQGMRLRAICEDWPIGDALESVLSGADKLPEGTVKREMLNYWNALHWEAQNRLVAEVRRELKKEDRLIGRRVER